MNKSFSVAVCMVVMTLSLCGGITDIFAQTWDQTYNDLRVINKLSVGNNPPGGTYAELRYFPAINPPWDDVYWNLSLGSFTLSDNYSGFSNVAFGNEVLFKNVTGSYNTGIGTHVLSENIDGIYNTAVGGESLAWSLGSYNTAIGTDSLFAAPWGIDGCESTYSYSATGNSNTAVGAFSMECVKTASANVAIGRGALKYNAIGNDNVAIGRRAGVGQVDPNDPDKTDGQLGYDYAIRYGNGNIFIGNGASPGIIETEANPLTNAIAIGFNAQVAADNSMVLGGTGQYAVNVGIGTDTPLTKLHVRKNSSGYTPNEVVGLFVENSGSMNDYYVLQTATAGGGKSFSVTNAGNVGIGTTTPRSKLSVKDLPNTPPLGSANRGIVCITTDGDMWVDDDGTYDCAVTP